MKLDLVCFVMVVVGEAMEASVDTEQLSALVVLEQVVVELEDLVVL